MNLIGNIVNPPEPKRVAPEGERGSRKRGTASAVWDVITHHTWQLVGLNVLIFVCSIPIVTIPAVAVASSVLLRNMLDGRVVFVWHDFLNALAATWKRATACGLPVLAVMALAGFGSWFYFSVRMPFGWAFAVTCGVIAILAGATMIYLYPMVSMTSLPARQLWRNAAILVPLRFPSTVLTAVFDLLIVAAALLLFPYTVWVLPTCGMVLIGLANTATAMKAIRTFVVKSDGGPEA